MNTHTKGSSTSAHAMLKVFAENGIDRAYIVPGESYLGVLDALADYTEIDVVVCRHEGNAAFMAHADGKLTGRPGVVMVSRGPGATNASIGVHAAQQDGVPLILVVGQIPKQDLRKDAFQEIDYQQMFGCMAKWIYEVTDPEDLAAAAFKALRVATSGTPGPVVLVIPEDIQQQVVEQPSWKVVPVGQTAPSASMLADIEAQLRGAERPLIIASGPIGRHPRGREVLLRFAETFDLPVAVSYRQNDLFPHDHRLFAGHLEIGTARRQLNAFHTSDLLIALGSRLGDITTQGYTFPISPRPQQFLIHCFEDEGVLNKHYVADIALTANPVALMELLMQVNSGNGNAKMHTEWAAKLHGLREESATWPARSVSDGVPFASVVKHIQDLEIANLVICVDSGTFAAPVYRNFNFRSTQRLVATGSGAMGYGVPSAIVSQMRMPEGKVICMVGDGGFLMNGNDIIVAVERNLPIVFIVANNNCYGTIRVHQSRHYPHRHLGTTLTNPDFVAIAQAFGVSAEYVDSIDLVDAALRRGLESNGPYFIEVKTSLKAVL